MNPIIYKHTMDSLKSFLTKGGSIQGLLSQTPMQNPLLSNLIDMAKQGNIQGVESFARNIYKEQGRDFDKEFAEFKNMFK